MIRLFKNNSLPLVFLLIPYALLLRAYGFYKEVPIDFDNGGLLFDALKACWPERQYWSVGVALVLVLAQAVSLAFITNTHKHSSERSMLVALFYVLLASMGIAFLGFSPPLLGNTFLILALGNLFGTYKLAQPAGRHFNIGFWIALAALCYGCMSVFLLFALLAINVTRAFSLREMFQVVGGFAVPFILLFAGYYYRGELQSVYLAYPGNSFGILDIRNWPDWKGYLVIVTLGVLCSGAVLKHGALVAKQGMKTRKNVDIVFILILSIVTGWFVQAEVGIEHWITLAIPLSILLAAFSSKAKHPVWAEWWHLALMVIALVAQF